MLTPDQLLPWETGPYADLEWLPQAMRFKLDAVGIKVGLKQWQALPIEAKRQLLAAPIADEAAKEAWKQSLLQVLQTAGIEASNLPPASPLSWNPETQAQWQAVGFALTEEIWSQWSEFQKYVAEKTAFSKSSTTPLRDIAPHLGIAPLRA